MTIYGVKKTTNLTSALLYLELYIFMVEHSPTYLPIRKITYTVIHLPTYKIDRCFLGSPRGQNQIKFSYPLIKVPRNLYKDYNKLFMKK